MDNNIFVSQITEKIIPYIEKYLSTYSEGAFEEMPSMEEVDEMTKELNIQLLSEYPELDQILDPLVKDEEPHVTFFGGGILWIILVGALFRKHHNCCRCNCGRNCRCNCDRNCRCGTGCRCF